VSREYTIQQPTIDGLIDGFQLVTYGRTANVKRDSVFWKFYVVGKQSEPTTPFYHGYAE